jgi:hypothetical protein
VVDGVRGHAEHDALWEVVAVERYARAGGDDAWEAEGGGAVDTHCLFDDCVDVGEVFDLTECWYFVCIGDCCIEFLLKFRDDVRVLEAVVQECA